MAASRSNHHKVLRLAFVAAMCAATTSLPAPTPAEATNGTCRVTNLRTDTTYLGNGSNLQKAINAAKRSDTLRIKGRCVGNFSISKGIKLRGVSTTRFPFATLDGGDSHQVLSISRGTVVIRDLRVTNGRDGSNPSLGGGIFNMATLTLSGSTSVQGNVGFLGGGIHNHGVLTLLDSSSVRINRGSMGGGIYNANEGTVILDDSSTVSRNRATRGGGISSRGIVVLNDSSSVRRNAARKGGGIEIFGNFADVTLNGSSVVSGNTARSEGGGIINDGLLTLNDSASVVRNSSLDLGGGIFNLQTVVLNDSSSVIDNTAGTAGGGIFDSSGTVYLCSNLVALSPNTPDDPPTTTTC
jgi:hypothetical protein